MIELKNDSWELLPKKIQKRVNDFIDNLPKIPWFKPREDLKKSEVEKQINLTLECFWVKAKIEYKKLATEQDWASARASAWDSAWDSAWASARASALDSNCASAWDSAWDSAWASARASAWASVRAYALASAWAFAWSSDCASAWASAWDSARASAWDSAWSSARASAEILVMDNKDFKNKFPKWAFIHLFKLWEMWLYPVWVLKENKKFVVYVPIVDWKYPKSFKFKT